MVKFQPIIKWSGSKRSQCEEILSYFPETIETYYEPFCGGCSMLMGLLNSDISVKRYVCSDLNGDLISLWNLIKTNSEIIYNSYTKSPDFTSFNISSYEACLNSTLFSFNFLLHSIRIGFNLSGSIPFLVR